MITTNGLLIIAKSISARGLRIADNIAWWERLVERLNIAERWEYLDADDAWVKFWRRNGNVPDKAIPVK